MPTTKKVKEIEEEIVKPTRKFKNDELIPCKSITNGKLLVDGDKSGILYKWADYGDVEEVEYRDLLYMVRSRAPWVYKPRLIVLDEDFIEQNPDLKNIYDSMYEVKDLRDILKMSPSQMKKTIDSLPVGAKEAIKGVAATMIDRGQLDSVEKIKVLDEIFGTKLLFTLAQS